MKPRSQLGGDFMNNLIAICVRCHGKRHAERRSVEATYQQDKLNGVSPPDFEAWANGSI